MSSYLLPCDCGAKVTISRSQAGMSLLCPQCSTQLQVPTIRNMSLLAAAESPVDKSKPHGHSTKGTRNRSPIFLGLLAAAFMLVAIGSLAYAGWIAYERYSILSNLSESKVDLSKTEEDFLKEIRATALQAPPADTWDYWNLLANQGLSEPNPPDFFRIKRYLAAQKPVMNRWFAIGGVSLALFVATAFITQKMTKRE